MKNDYSTFAVIVALKKKKKKKICFIEILLK